MWTGGKPPPIPKSRTPSRSNSPSFRNGRQEAELEALRQRGLSKLLNKHFSEATAKLAAENAAADAALRDLEARKEANNSPFHVSPNGTSGELSPFDAMFLSVHQWRNECRRKERETLMLYQSYVHKFGATGQITVPFSGPVTPSRPPRAPSSVSTSSKTGTGTGTPMSPAVSARLSAPPPAQTPPSHTAVPAMTAAIENTLEDYLRKGAVSLPSIETMGKDATYQTTHSKEEAEFRNFYRRQLEGRGIDARASPTSFSEKHAFTGPGAFDSKGGPFMRPIQADEGDEWESVVQDGSAPLFVNDDIDDNASIMSGLTCNSAMTREVMQEVESVVVDFLRSEQASIRKIMEEEANLEDASVSNESYASLIGSTSGEAADQAENLAKQMELILTKFEGQSQAKPSPRKQGRRLETSNAEEEWMILYDESYQREYYHEVKSNRTQWEPPTKEGAAAIMASPTISHTEVMPEFEGRSMSRITQYRRMRRRRRRRRIMGLAILAASSMVGGAFYLQNDPVAAETVSNWYVAQMTTEAVHKVVNMELLESLTGRPSLQTLASGDKVANQVELRLVEETQARRALAERQALLVAEAKAASMASVKAASMASVKAASMASVKAASMASVKAASMASVKAASMASVTAASMASVKAASMASAEKEPKTLSISIAEMIGFDLDRRPWGCNIPLAYAVHGKCRRLASENPMFDLQELINAMMQ
jgi:hypothetical protein